MLAWAVDDWGRERLSPSVREHLRQARKETLRELETEVSRKATPE